LSFVNNALLWVGGSISAAIIGGAAYDALKAALRRLRIRNDVRLAMPDHSDAVAIAYAAAAVRWHDIGRGQLRDHEISKVAASKNSDGGWQVRFWGPQIRIDVLILGYTRYQDQVKTKVEIPRAVLRDEPPVTASKPDAPSSDAPSGTSEPPD
jgi:hypothetical protein